jgi:16S rRNA (cytosine967-C5)-methyltransferase
MATLAGVGGALSLARHDNEEPPTVVRLARGVTKEQITAEGVTVRPHAEGANLFVIEGAKQSLLADLAARGLAQVQDPTAAKVVSYLELKEGQTVLDRCAGLGTKTLQMREMVGSGGKILAVDSNVPRCKRLAQLLAKRGVENVHIEPVGMLSDVKTPLPQFDRVLVDAPCSNSGTLARRPEARYFQGEKAMASLRELQLRILDDTASHVARVGVMVYSTCSIWPGENKEVVATFLESHRDFELVKEESTLPSGAGAPATEYHDGGYLAVLRRVR